MLLLDHKINTMVWKWRAREWVRKIVWKFEHVLVMFSPNIYLSLYSFSSYTIWAYDNTQFIWFPFPYPIFILHYRFSFYYFQLYERKRHKENLHIFTILAKVNMTWWNHMRPEKYVTHIHNLREKSNAKEQGKFVMKAV